MNKVSKLSFSLAIVLFAATSANIFSMDSEECSSTPKCSNFSEEDIRRMSGEEFKRFFTPCLRSTYGMYWKAEHIRRQRAKLERLTKEKEEESCWSSRLYGSGLQLGNIFMTITCPIISQSLVERSGVQDRDKKILAGIGANVSCQAFRHWLFDGRIQEQKLRRAVRERTIIDILNEIKEEETK